MGLFFDAVYAGKMPKTKPTKVETNTPQNAPIKGKAKVKPKLKKLFNTKVINQLKTDPKVIPIIPPAKVNITASVKN